MKLDPHLTPSTKISLKWIKNTNLRAKSLQLLEENVSITFEEFGPGSGFLGTTPKRRKWRRELNVSAKMSF